MRGCDGHNCLIWPKVCGKEKRRRSLTGDGEESPEWELERERLGGCGVAPQCPAWHGVGGVGERREGRHRHRAGRRATGVEQQGAEEEKEEQRRESAHDRSDIGVFLGGVEAGAGFGDSLDVAMADYGEIAVSGAQGSDEGDDGASLFGGAGIGGIALAVESSDVAD